MKAARTCALLLAVGQICACAAETGVVFDTETQKPIAGAFVLATWDAQAVGAVVSKSVCYHFAMAVSDQGGRFEMSRYSWNVSPLLVERKIAIDVYAPAYVATTSELGPKLGLKRFEGTALQRLDWMIRRVREECVSKSQRSSLAPLYAAMLSEARSIAQTKEELVYVRSLRMELDRLRLGDEEALKRFAAGEYAK